VGDDAAPEERVRPAPRAVDELVGDDHVARCDLLAQAADRAHRDDPLHAECLHGVDVSPEVDLARKDPMAAPVAGQEDEACPAEAPDHEVVGRVAEGSLDAHALDPLEARELVEPAAAEDAERPIRHAFPAAARPRPAHPRAKPADCKVGRRVSPG
jgi:hypothetical protein